MEFLPNALFRLKPGKGKRTVHKDLFAHLQESDWLHIFRNEILYTKFVQNKATRKFYDL